MQIPRIFLTKWIIYRGIHLRNDRLFNPKIENSLKTIVEEVEEDYEEILDDEEIPNESNEKVEHLEHKLCFIKSKLVEVRSLLDELIQIL